jgi:hypothetical protein
VEIVTETSESPRRDVLCLADEDLEVRVGLLELEVVGLDERPVHRRPATEHGVQGLVQDPL